ncbi:hypothetical protein AB0D11_44290 [Streptomyces monashensis]|uniref:hypothetical protein n=1 Tax=Streptomyces monashensis TaxID=1678012 RepID=UPI0033E033E4
MSVGALITTAGSASASDAITTSTSHSIGFYNQPNTESGKPGWPDMTPGGIIGVDCWTVGESIGNYGNTWYRVYAINYNGVTHWLKTSVYAFAGYADGNAHSVNRDPNIPQC